MATCCGPERPGSTAVLDAGVMPVKPLNRDGMVRIPAGEFLMGTNSGVAYPIDGEGPERVVRLEEFWIDTMAVSNAAFAEFVDATGYVTEAEHIGWSFVPEVLAQLNPHANVLGRSAETPWWLGIERASWHQPEGEGSSIESRSDHPVVHVSWNDASAFAKWAGKRLPTEAEWEKAARGGLKRSLYPWGDELTPDGEHRCNIWQGNFPEYNSAEDGFLGTAPVSAFAPNGYGLYNVSGNVWEWCSDSWSHTAATKVIRGGSFMCHDSYCNRYRLSARTANTPDSSASHMGFRCAA